MGLRLSKTTGMMYSSYNEYIEKEIEPAFSRIRRYAKVELGEGTERIHNKESLIEYLKEATKREPSDRFVTDVMRTDAYSDIKERNLREGNIGEERFSTDKIKAKRFGLIFVGLDAKGKPYAYDFKKGKRVRYRSVL